MWWWEPYDTDYAFFGDMVNWGDCGRPWDQVMDGGHETDCCCCDDDSGGWTDRGRVSVCVLLRGAPPVPSATFSEVYVNPIVLPTCLSNSSIPL
jgi:hypothetical protein